MTREIPLQNGMTALVDDADYEALSAFTWSAELNGKVWYVSRKEQIRPRSHPDGRKIRKIQMHRQIMAPPDGTDIDHINHDGLDNRRCNLRTCTRGQNTAHQRSRREGQFRGVYANSGKWSAAISGHPGTLQYLGFFDDPVDAAKAYDRAALKRFGEFATLNFPEGSR